MQFIDLKAQYNHLQDKINSRINNVLDSGQYIMGDECKELEAKLAAYVGVEHAIGVANGTDALQLALMALNVGEGDAVFVPSFTFFASAEVVSLVGATPVFVDVEPSTFNLCINSLEKQLNDTLSKGKLKPKAIIAVDLFGLPADYEAISKLANQHDLRIIEDAAQGFGGTLNGGKAGSFGDIATTSFFPAKPLGCYGDGGAVFTNDVKLADMVKSLKVHGKGQDKYDNVRIGLNSRLDTIQAAILLEKLAVFDEELIARNKLADFYSANIKSDFIKPIVPANQSSSWAQYTLQHESRDSVMAHLKQQGVPSMVYYATPMHLQTAFSHLTHSESDLAISTKLSKNVFSLPMHPYMSDEDAQKVINAINSF